MKEKAAVNLTAMSGNAYCVPDAAYLDLAAPELHILDLGQGLLPE